MISVTEKGVTQDSIKNNPYWKDLFIGWGEPI